MKTVKSFVFIAVIFNVTLLPMVSFGQDFNRSAKRDLRDLEESTEPAYPKRSKATAQRQVDVTSVKTLRVLPAAQNTVTVPVAPQPVAQQTEVVTQTIQPAAPQPIYIVQQPTTNVDATPVKESRADQLRKQREEFEHQNESRLIERLEDDRLNSEKERLDRIMGPKSAAPNPTPAPTPAPQTAAPAPVVQPAPTPAVVVVQPAPQKEEIKPIENIVPAEGLSKTSKEEQKEEKKEERSRIAVGGLVGIGNYPSASNVSGAYALGAVVELTLPNRFAVEGTIAYSSYDIKNVGYCLYCFGSTLVTTMNQWDITGGVKYKILSGMVTPVVGAMLGYSRRDYQSRLSWGYGVDSGTGSNAFEGGLLIGADIKCTENLYIGADFRYMMNISYRTDNPLAYGYFGNSVYVGSPIESLNYYLASINAKISF